MFSRVLDVLFLFLEMRFVGMLCCDRRNRNGGVFFVFFWFRQEERGVLDGMTELVVSQRSTNAEVCKLKCQMPNAQMPNAQITKR